MRRDDRFLFYFNRRHGVSQPRKPGVLSARPSAVSRVLWGPAFLPRNSGAKQEFKSICLLRSQFLCQHQVCRGGTCSWKWCSDAQVSSLRRRYLVLFRNTFIHGTPAVGSICDFRDGSWAGASLRGRSVVSSVGGDF